MSSINSVGTSLFNFLQTIAPATQTPATTSTSNTTATTPTPSTTSTTSVDPTGTSGVQGGHHHHHHGGGGSGGELFKKIEQSVTQALQAAQSSETVAAPMRMRIRVRRSRMRFQSCFKIRSRLDRQAAR